MKYSLTFFHSKFNWANRSLAAQTRINRRLNLFLKALQNEQNEMFVTRLIRKCNWIVDKSFKSFSCIVLHELFLLLYPYLSFFLFHSRFAIFFYFVFIFVAALFLILIRHIKIHELSSVFLLDVLLIRFSFVFWVKFLLVFASCNRLRTYVCMSCVCVFIGTLISVFLHSTC